MGDEYGQEIINEQNSFFNAMDDKLDELLEFMGNGIKATDVTYNNSNVKLALDSLSTHDAELSLTSTNSLQNKVITENIQALSTNAKTLLASGTLSAAGDTYTFPSDMTVLVYRIMRTGYYSSQTFFSYPKINDGAASRCVDFNGTKLQFTLTTTAISTPSALASGYTIIYRAYK